MRRLAGELEKARERTALELGTVSDFDKTHIAPAKEALDKRGEEVQALKAQLEKLAHDMKQANARHTTEANMHTRACSAAHTPACILARTQHARMRANAVCRRSMRLRRLRPRRPRSSATCTRSVNALISSAVRVRARI